MLTNSKLISHLRRALRAMLPLGAFACAAILWTQPASGQRLTIKVVDQFSDAVVNTTLAIQVQVQVSTDSAEGYDQ